VFGAQPGLGEVVRRTLGEGVAPVGQRDQAARRGREATEVSHA